MRHCTSRSTPSGGPPPTTGAIGRVLPSGSLHAIVGSAQEQYGNSLHAVIILPVQHDILITVIRLFIRSFSFEFGSLFARLNAAKIRRNAGRNAGARPSFPGGLPHAPEHQAHGSEDGRSPPVRKALRPDPLRPDGYDLPRAPVADQASSSCFRRSPRGILRLQRF